MADVSQIKLPNGDTFDLVDEKSGYITAQYIENKTDYSIPVSRVGEIVVGETAIGTDSTNFPTSKAVVDYVDERVVQEIEAIDIPTVPTKTSDLTNDSGYLTTSDIASVMTYKGTKVNYATLPSTGNTTGDVWHLTDTGAEWAWDGSTWQELGTAIDLSNYATKATTLAGYGITDAKIQNGTITLGSNTITPLTSFTETDPTVPSWAKQSSKPSYGLTEISGTDDLRAIEGLTGTSGLLKKTAANTWTLDTNTYSHTDEKLSVSNNTETGNFGLIITQTSSTAPETKKWDSFLRYYRSSATEGILQIGSNGEAIGKVRLYTTTSNGYTTIQPSATNNRTVTLPDKTGTIALTSDIPQVYSSTNTGGYLTMATLPIYDGTVV